MYYEVLNLYDVFYNIEKSASVFSFFFKLCDF